MMQQIALLSLLLPILSWFLSIQSASATTKYEDVELSPSIVTRTDDDQSNSELSRAQAAIDDEDYPRAIEILQQLLIRVSQLVGTGKVHDAVHPYGDAGPPQRIFLGTRAIARRMLASLPEPARALYKKRHEERAASRLRAGHAALNRDHIREVADTYPLTDAAFKARLLLGDLAFEEGEIPTAERHYRDLLVEGSPDRPTVELARITARIALCLSENRSSDRLKQVREQYEMECDAVSIPFRGELRQWREILDDATAKADQPTDRSFSGSCSWPVFCGNNSRNRVANDLEGPVSIEFQHPKPKDSSGPSSARLRLDRESEVLSWPSPLLASYPVIDGNQGIAYCWSTRSLLAIDLESGNPIWEKSLRVLAQSVADLIPASAPPAPEKKRLVTPRGRLTVLPAGEFGSSRFGHNSGERPVYLAIAGPYLLAMVDFLVIPSSSGRPVKVLLALDRYNGGEVIWSAGARDFDDPLLKGLELAAAPVVRENRVFVGGRRIANERKAFVLGLDLTTGKPIYWTFLCSGPNRYPSDDQDPETPSLSEAGGVLYCSTGLGVLAALNSETGEVRWIYRYRRFPLQGSQGAMTLSYRNPWRDDPMIISGDRLYSTPPDSSHLQILFLAPEAGSGSILNDKIDKGNLDYAIGVDRGWIFLAGRSRDGRQQIVEAFHPDSPTKALQWDFVIPNPPPSREMMDHLKGRGLVGLSNIYVPTEKAIYALQKQTGRVAQVITQALPNSNVSMETGNVIPAPGGFLLATPGGIALLKRTR